MDFETRHACGHTSRISAERERDDQRVLTMGAESCSLCKADNWLSAYRKIAPPLVGPNPDLVEAADFQRILTIKDVERRHEEIRATVILLLSMGRGNISDLQSISQAIASIYDAVMKAALRELDADWWIENGCLITDTVNEITLEGLLGEFDDFNDH